MEDKDDVKNPYNKYKPYKDALKTWSELPLKEKMMTAYLVLVFAIVIFRVLTFVYGKMLKNKSDGGKSKKFDRGR